MTATLKKNSNDATDIGILCNSSIHKIINHSDWNVWYTVFKLNLNNAVMNKDQFRLLIISKFYNQWIFELIDVWCDQN